MEIGTKVRVYNTESETFLFNGEVVQQTTTNVTTKDGGIFNCSVIQVKNLDKEREEELRYVFYNLPEKGYVSDSLALYAL